MKVMMAYDGGSGEPNVVSGGGDVVDGGDGGDGGRDPYGTVFDDTNVGAAPSGTTENRKYAVALAINFDKALKRKGIKETSLDAWLEYYGKYRLSVATPHPL